MKYRVLGKTGVKVSEVGFGAWAIGGNAHGNSYGPTNDEDSMAAVRKAVDLGCNFFDTADVYGHGHSEELLGKALSGDRENMIIATKVGGDFYHGAPRMNFSPDYLDFALKKSLERLKTSYVDLYQLHNPPLELMKSLDVFQALERLKESGRIRHYGVSIHDPQEGLVAMQTGDPSAIQVVFNVLRQEAKNELFRAAASKNVAIIAREPLANGFLTGKHKSNDVFSQGDIRRNFPRQYVANLVQASDQLGFLETRIRNRAQAAIRFVLDHNEISTAIPGVKTPEQANENLNASELPSLTGEEHLRIKFLRERGFAS
jgi:aryl-alcohol dehydrogenase-like predicted oxidoreductase